MSNMQQDAARMAQAQNTLSEGRAKFDNLGGKLSNELEAMAKGWQGQGGTAFQEAHRAWSMKFGEINKILDQLSNALGTASRTATSSDESVSAEARTITGGVESTGFNF